MVITLTGTNAAGLRQRLRQLTQDFIKCHGELAVERIDAEETEAQAVLDAVASLPFLAEKKLVIVRNFSANKQAADVIEQLIGFVHDGVDVILHEPQPDKRTALYKALKKGTQFEEFNQMEGRDLAAWLAKSAKEQGGQISLADANYLIERVGHNQSLLANELDKLITYDPAVNRASIDLLTEKNPQSKVFDLLDATFAGQKQRALTLYAEQRAQKVEPQEILAMIAWQIRLVVAAKLGKGKLAATIASDLGMSSYPIQKAQSLAARMTTQELANLVDRTTKIDRLSKNKTIDLDEALKSYIVTI